MRRHLLVKVIVSLLAVLMLTQTVMLVSCGNNDKQDTETGESATTADTETENETKQEESTSKPGQASPTDSFVPAIRFAVCSDTHVSSASTEQAKRLIKLLKSAYGYAEKDANYSELDAVLIVGDLTNEGKAEEFKALKLILNRYVKDDTKLMTVMGNHEYYGGSQTVYTSNMDQPLNLHEVVGGYHFIGISTNSANGDYTAKTIDFLKNELEAAEADAPDKPIFVFQHHHIADTVYVSSEWNTPDSKKIDAVLSQYPQVIDFSGHSHAPINNPTTIYQKDYTALGTGTLQYFEMASGMSYGTIPPNASESAQYYIIEVDESNMVRIRPYNILTDSFFKTPSDLDDPNEELTYYVDIKEGKEGFRYVDRKADSDVPFFKENAAITIKDLTPDELQLSIPQASDDDCIYSYRFAFLAKDGSSRSYNYFANYYIEPLDAEQTFSFSGLLGGMEYTLKVYPVDCYGMEGDPIELSFATPKGTYVSEYEVNFMGTFTNFDHLTDMIRSDNSVAYGGTANGDYWMGQWDGPASHKSGQVAIEAGKGYNGSNALAVWSSDKENKGLYLFASEDNGFSTFFPENKYLRVWVDFTGVDLRKGNFGVLSKNGGIYTTDEYDNNSNLPFYYLPEGSDTWKSFKHGDDGCFGTAQGTPIMNFRGWLAFPVQDFGYRNGTGANESGGSFSSKTIMGIYLFWDYDDSMKTNSKFYLDEIQFCNDYKVFTEYEAE